MNETLLDVKIVRIDRVFSGVAVTTVRQWIAERRVLPEDLVRPVGAERWMKVSLAPELAPEKSAANPEPRPTARPATTEQSDGELGIDVPAKSRPRRKRRLLEDTELDMTPMIDVTFQLLIFFIFSNQLANAPPIEVPQAHYGKGIMPDGKQSILIDDQGRYYLGESANDQNLAPTLDQVVSEVAKNAEAAQQPLEVIVSAHKRARHQQVRELVERLGDVQRLGPVHLGVEEKP